ncbi:OmpP1/FadL family transporter [Paracoccus sp. JM45]|uniref:OmpP1/FadL family transporter n=1 Tax=Paracoccus sp. JM45 TaxID=2283626 RepID=UPI000E6B667A|nr:outer membrane protein transport protein [Paracoccus sp. JM45]RJE81131.1 aromatic hydrocarbon degradation protein [Paracoccus sp. JM45]
MKIASSGIAILMLSASQLFAGGIERAPQSLNALFEDGNYIELSFGGVNPTVEGTDFLGSATGDVAQGYGFTGLSYKQQFTEAFSGAIIVEQPFGADILYPTVENGGSSVFGGTLAQVDSTTFTALGRYKMPNNFSVHGGIRGSRADATVSLNGLAYGSVSGYTADLESDTGIGWVAGAAWEKPEIAARISLTYNSKIEHNFRTTETLDPDGSGPIAAQALSADASTTTVDTPESWNLEFQTGVAEDTLVFGSVRWVNWSDFRVDPAVFTALTGSGLVDLEDTTTYTIGVGRRFTEKWSGSAAFSYEKAGDKLVSPLAPTTGRKGITLAAIYTEGPIKVTTGVSYIKLGDANAQTADTARAYMEDSDAWGAGMRIGYSF